MSALDDMLARLRAMPPEERKEIEEAANQAVKGLVWFPNTGPQAEAYHSQADVLLYGGSGGSGKALALHTPLATPSGWTTMGEVSIGDQLFDETGRPCRVTAISPVMVNRQCYRVGFSDGSEIIADADHRWFTSTALERQRKLRATKEWRDRRSARRAHQGRVRKPWLAALNKARSPEGAIETPDGGVRTTQEIFETQTINKGRETNHAVAVAASIDLPDADLPIDPYVLGAWLGDGSSYKAEITTTDPEILETLNLAGYDTTSRTAITYGVSNLKVKLNVAGLVANKHIPQQYLRASLGQRLALLQGLMDTDGCSSPSKGDCEFTTTKERLAFDVQELVCSLGIKAAIGVGRATLYGKDCGAKYRINFLTDLPAFRLERKLVNQKRSGFRGTVKTRYITSVEPVASEPVKCVAVDSPSHLYLVGRTFIPTHNTDLGLGLAFTKHQRSLILRRQYANLGGLTERALQIHTTRQGFNGSPPPLLRTTDGRYIQFGANQRLGDEQAWQGQPFDYKYFDEACQFLELQVRFHMGWLRTATPGQRCRIVLGTNPPLDSTGDWLIKMFRAWLDITYAKPAKHGELRWYVTVEDGTDLEVEEADLGRDDMGRRPIQIQDKTLYAMSRTFIPGKLVDNPYLSRTDYQSRLDSLPEPIRSAVRDGNFMAARQDAAFQVIPTQWVIEAQARWRPDGYKQFAMTAMGYDPAGGGKDAAELSYRHGPWFGEITTVKGKETADGSASAGTIIKHRRDNAPVIVDCGGGYGGAVCLRLDDNAIVHIKYNGVNPGVGRSKDRTLGFANRRAQSHWRFREALDPDQEGGSEIALPPDPELLSDLTTPTFEVGPKGIQIEKKEDIKERIGRSPGKGDSVIMCYDGGNEAVRRNLSVTNGANRPTQSNVGYASVKGYGNNRPQRRR